MDVNLVSQIAGASQIAVGRNRESKGSGGSSGNRRSGGGSVQDGDIERLDKEWEEDLVAFARYKIMRSGYEEAKQGNNRLTELRQQAASLVVLGSNIQSAERKLLVECYDKAYHKQALEALLVTKHPHMVGHTLNKIQVIGHLIDAGAGFPTMQEWPQIMNDAAKLQAGPRIALDHDGNGESEEDDKDASKAQRHSQANIMERSRPLSVVKRGKGASENKLSSSSISSSSFASSAFPLGTNLQRSKDNGSSSHISSGTSGSISSGSNGSISSGSNGTNESKGASRSSHSNKNDSKQRITHRTGTSSSRDTRAKSGAVEVQQRHERRGNEAAKDSQRPSDRNAKRSKQQHRSGTYSEQDRLDHKHASRRRQRSRDEDKEAKRSVSRPRSLSKSPKPGTRSPLPRRQRSRSPRLFRRNNKGGWNNKDHRGERGPNKRDDPYYRKDINKRNRDNRISGLSTSRERNHLDNTKLTRKVEDMVKQQLASFKAAYDAEFQDKLMKGQDEAYKKGRKDAEMKDLDLWIPPVDPRLVERAKRLEFIDLGEIKAVLAKSKGKDKSKDKAIFKIDEATGTLKVDEETIPKDKEAIKWLEWQALFADLMDYYLIHGCHLEKTADMLTYFRLMQRLGQEGIFTFESLQVMDYHIRSRKEGQGENFT